MDCFLTTYNTNTTKQFFRLSIQNLIHRLQTVGSDVEHHFKGQLDFISGGGRFFIGAIKLNSYKAGVIIILLRTRLMLADQIATETMGSETLPSETTSPISERPFACIFQPHLDSGNRVVKNDSTTTDGQKTSKVIKPPAKPKRTKETWQLQQELEYFCAVIIFSYQNPCLRLSWEQWKPKRFYNFLQAHMKEIFGERCRNGRQCKAKDQNFKIQNHDRPQKRSSMDLVQLSKDRLVAYIKKKKQAYKSGKSLSCQELQRAERFEMALTNYDDFVKGMKQLTPLETELEKLKTYEESIATLTAEIWRNSIEA